MHYVIVSKDVYEGTLKSDASDPCSITEIATELIITRLHLLNEYRKERVWKTDTIVCIEDRKCLYTKIFPNVISFKEYQALTLEDADTVDDYLNPALFNALAGGNVSDRLIPYLPFYLNYERDKELIESVDFGDLSNYNVSKPFVCLVARRRGAWTEKNMDNVFWFDVVKLLKQSGVQTFIFGKDADIFCTSDKTVHIQDYRDWCSIVRHSNCMHVASTMTGAVYPLLIFGNPKAKMTIIDNTRLMDRHGNDPSFYHPCINFSKIDIEFINQIPTPEEFYGKITRDFNL